MRTGRLTYAPRSRLYGDKDLQRQRQHDERTAHTEHRPLGMGQDRLGGKTLQPGAVVSCPSGWRRRPHYRQCLSREGRAFGPTCTRLTDVVGEWRSDGARRDKIGEHHGCFRAPEANDTEQDALERRGVRLYLREMINFTHSNKTTAVPNRESRAAVERSLTVTAAVVLVAAVVVDPAIEPLDEGLA